MHAAPASVYAPNPQSHELGAATKAKAKSAMQIAAAVAFITSTATC
jgi:hypothetical protein